MCKNNFTILLIGAVLIAMLSTTGCDTKGPAEKAGAQVDQSIEAVKDTVEDVGDKISGKGPAEKVGEDIDEAIGAVKKSIESSDK